MTELVSVILPVHNRAPWITRAAASVFSQTYTAHELIVVDDGSTDDTPHVLQSLESRATVLRQPHSGVYAARNLGLRHARGALIAFIDSDDAWLPERLARQVPLMRPNVGLVFGDAEHMTGDPARMTLAGATSFGITPPARGRAAAHFAWGNFVPTSSVLVRRSCLEETGGFSLTESVSSDYLQWFQIVLKHECDFVPEPVVAYTVHADGLSHDLGRSLAARIRLFRSELTRTTDPPTRRVLRRLLFNLSLHLSWAAARGYAGKRPPAMRLAWRTAIDAAGTDAPAWAAAFAAHHLALKGGRQPAGRTT